jgi:hypothetical protein
MPRPLRPCGTEAAYRRHLARSEPACPDCLAAHARYTRRTPRPRPIQPCGTDAAYYRHRALRQTPCLPCYDAHAAAERARYARRQARPNHRQEVAA